MSSPPANAGREGTSGADATPEPADKQADQQPGLGRERNVGGQADKYAERHPDRRSDNQKQPGSPLSLAPGRERCRRPILELAQPDLDPDRRPRRRDPPPTSRPCFSAPTPPGSVKRRWSRSSERALSRPVSSAGRSRSVAWPCCVPTRTRSTTVSSR